MMNSFIWNLIEINILIIVLFTTFLLIRKWLNFVQQRILLIGLPAIAVLTILVKVTFTASGYAYALPLVELEPVIVGTNQGSVQNFGFFITPDQLYLIGIGIGLIVLLIRLCNVLFFFNGKKGVKDGAYRIYSVDGKDSFSFFGRIQVAPELIGSDREIVLEHEKMHADKYHSLDILVVELFHVVFWFNPIFVFIKRQLISLHEFEVDGEMYRRHRLNYMHFLLNYSFGLNSSKYLLTNRFYNRLTLKKRIEIMKTKTKNKRAFLLMFPLLALAFGSVQCTKENKDDTLHESDAAPTEMAEQEKIYEKVDQYPVFPGGDQAMMKYIGENVVYPKEASEKGIEGTIFVSFVVSKTGDVEQCEVKREVDPLLDAEALRVISEMPNWEPGVHEGKKVAVRYTIPIRFALE